MQLVEVQDNKEKRQFLDVVNKIYKDSPNWIRPLDKDIEKVFDPSKNKFFQRGEAIRWILKSNSQVIGRVAAFIDKKKAFSYDQPTGGMGFFECIDDREAAFALFDAVKSWLEKKGMEAMDGPVNFGERDRWWGLLVDGFLPPTYGMNYHPPYYRKFFEDYGFKIYFRQFTYYRKVADPIAPKYRQKAENIYRDTNYRFAHIEKSRLKFYTECFRHVYNKAWANHENFKSMSKDQAWRIVKSLKPVMVEDLLWFGYYKDEPVSFFIMLPELNQLFRHFNGKWNWWNRLRFLWYQWTKSNRKIFGLVFGVSPEHQGKGVEGAMILAAANLVQPQDRWDDIEMTWIGDFNPKMRKIVENLGARIIKTHITYRKLFDESKPFKRAAEVNI